MLLARDVAVVETDFIQVLEHIPGTKDQKQEHFLSWDNSLDPIP